MSDNGPDNESNSKPASTPPPVEMPRQRFVTGVCIWVTGQLSPLLIPLIVSSGLSDSLKATLSGLVFIGLPPLFTFVAIVILGKDGFNYLKFRILKFFKREKPPRQVGKPRFYIGLTLFSIILVFAWLSPYFGPVCPWLEQNKVPLALAGDIALIVSLLILGGDFWEKLRNLFVYPASDTSGSATP